VLFYLLQCYTEKIVLVKSTRSMNKLYFDRTIKILATVIEFLVISARMFDRINCNLYVLYLLLNLSDFQLIQSDCFSSASVTI